MAVPTIIALRREYREWKQRQRSGPEAQIAHRHAIKKEIESNLRWPEHDPSPEIIVRDLARVDKYPEVDDSLRGISPWFKVEVLGYYHRGLEVGLSVRSVVISGSDARDVPADDDDGGARTMIHGARLPFDAIVLIDWDGDEYNPQPHFYCWFDQAEGPYEATHLYEKDSRGHWSRREDLRYRPERRPLLRAWRDRRELRKVQRDFERELASL